MTMNKVTTPLFLICVLLTPSWATADSSSSQVVEVETIEVSPAKPAADGNKAAELWDKTKEETGEAASTAAEYSKVQGTRALNATKKGVKKGTEVVTEGSKKAWSATKTTTKKAVDATGKALKKTGAAISEAVESDDNNAPVEDRSVEGS